MGFTPAVLAAWLTASERDSRFSPLCPVWRQTQVLQEGGTTARL